MVHNMGGIDWHLVAVRVLAKKHVQCVVLESANVELLREQVHVDDVLPGWQPVICERSGVEPSEEQAERVSFSTDVDQCRLVWLRVKQLLERLRVMAEKAAIHMKIYVWFFSIANTDSHHAIKHGAVLISQ